MNDTAPLFIVHATAPQEPDTGDFQHRVFGPDAALGALPGVMTVSCTTITRHRARLFDEADVLVLQMMADPDLIVTARRRAARGQVTVFEISDNFFEFQPTNPMRPFYEDPDNRSTIIQLARVCDALQFSTKELNRRFGFLNPRHDVFENQLASVGPAEKTESPIVVGWGGSAGHHEDMTDIAPVLTAWLNSRDEVFLAVMGSRDVFDMFSGVPASRKRFVPHGSMREYFEFIESLHIGLAPMRKDPFNECRSDGKFIEYASRGVVPVCRRLAPYASVRDGETGFLYDTPEEFFDKLDRLVSDPPLRKKIALAAHAAAAERTHAKKAPEREAFYRSLLKNHNRGALPRWPAELPGADRTENTNHFLLRFGDVERLLYDGMVFLAHAARREDALAAFRKAAALAPDFHLPLLYQCLALNQADRKSALKAARRAAAVAPDSVLPLMNLATLLRTEGDAGEAENIFTKIAGMCDRWAGGYAGLATIHLTSGRLAEAETALANALESQPDHVPALAALGSIFLNDGRADEAAALFRRAADICPRSAPIRTGLGLACVRSGEEMEGVVQLFAALRLSPAASDAFNEIMRLAKDRYAKGRIPEAEKLLRFLREVLPANIESLFWLARTVERSGGHDANALWKDLAEKDTAGRYRAITSKKIGTSGA